MEQKKIYIVGLLREKKIIKNNRKIYRMYQRKVIQLLESGNEMDLLLLNDAIRMLSRLEVLCRRGNQSREEA